VARPGSPKLVIQQYRGSHDFLGLRAATRKEYDRILNHLAVIDALVINDLTAPDIVQIRDNIFKKRNRSFANKTLAILSILFSYSVERGFADSNPVRQVKKLRKRGDADRKNRHWTKAELDSVITRAAPHLALPLMIGRWTGLRESDVLHLGIGAFDGKTIRCRTSKRGVWVTIPVASPLKLALENRPRHDVTTICANSRGQSWTSDGFKTSLFKFVRQLEVEGIIAKGLTFHGLRHTVATELRELGFDTRTIADMLGQKSESMAAHYSRDADLHEKLKPAVEKMEIAEETRTNLSRKSEKSV
jgi:integrase